MQRAERITGPRDDEPTLHDTSPWCSFVFPDVVCYLIPRSYVTRQHVARLASKRSPHVMERPRPKDSNQLRSFAIALRFSSRLRDPLHGFKFGRLQGRCDLHFDAPTYAASNDRIDNEHFRIFLEADSGAPILKDHSRGGTIVDGTLLKTRDRRKSLDAGIADRNPWDTKTLRDGSSIVLTLSEELGEEAELSFYVRFPQNRTGEQQELYESNLLAYRKRLAVTTSRREELVVFPPASPSPAKYIKGHTITHSQHQVSTADQRGIPDVPQLPWLWGVRLPYHNPHARAPE
ncbi:hypothetical protein PG999_003668 [Apiospora kogelbergensis]|uniref:FHA domain-containing protein n=1 Tax=Apiospora kogelbergensis TaxID=1337665 RepID=A0AAW0R448_9PEZI